MSDQQQGDIQAARKALLVPGEVEEAARAEEIALDHIEALADAASY